MKKWLIPLIGLTLSLAVAGIVTGFTLSGGSEGMDPGDGKVVTSIDDIDPKVCNLMHNRKPCTPEELGVAPHGDPTYDEWLSDFGDGKVVTSIDDIDPKVCNLIHNRKPCTPEELGVAPHGDPTYDEWLSYFGDGKVVTSIDDIDPKVCNLIHNRKPCTPEGLEELGNLAAISWIVDPGTEVVGEPEPPFLDGEPVTIEECDLAGGTFWASFDGKVGCDIVNDLEDGGEGETQAQLPLVFPELEPLPAN